MVRDCPYVKENRQNCRCVSTDCVRKGICCECVAAHRAYNSFPYCLQLMLGERGLDIKKIE